MPRLSVPKEHKPRIEKLLTLDPGAFDALVSALKRYPEVKGDLLRLSSIAVPGLPKNESKELLNTIESLYRVWASRGNQSFEIFVGDLADAIVEFYPDGASDQSKSRLRAILGIETLARSSKALAVSTDHQRVFYDAKILSDIRYAFRPDIEAEPYGATIVHILKVVFHEDTDHKNVYIALDDDDLNVLKGVIERAQFKARRLREHLARASVPYLGKNGR